MAKKNENENLVQVSSYFPDAPMNNETANIEEPKPPTNPIEVVQSPEKKVVPEKPRREKKPLENHIHFKIESDITDKIAPGKILRANFFTPEIHIEYVVQDNDDAMTALNILRNAIFAAWGNLKLPKHCTIKSIYNYVNNSAYAVALAPYVSSIGGIDCKFEVF